MTTAAWVVATVTLVPISWPSSSTSVGRCSKRRSDTEPRASETACASMLLTRSIGTKMGRRLGSSTTMPSTRGACLSTRTAATRSRTLPIDSPPGPYTGSPSSWAAKTLLLATT